MSKVLSLSFVAALCAASSFGAIRAVTPTAWNGDKSCWQMKRHNEKMAVVTNGGAKVVFIGDSITHFWEGAGAGVWKKYFAEGPRKALNLGTSADRTEHVLWRMTEGRELDGYEAKVILLMIGTNNSGHFPFEQETPIDTICGIREILRIIAEKQPTARVILTSIFPRGADASDACRKRNDVVNKEIAKFADGKRVVWCDFSDKFLDAEGRLSREIFPDLLHPNALGYEMWASAVVPLVDKALAAKPDEAIPSVWPSNPRNYSLEAKEALRPTSAFGRISWWDQGILLQHRNEIVKNGQTEFDIVMVGDSITHRWEREGGEGRELFAELKKTYSILNLGIGGDQTQHVLWRLQNGELEGYTAKMFTVMIGTNNGGRDEASIAEAIRRIVELIREKHPESKIVLMPIFPRSAKPDDAARAANDRINTLIRDCADGWLADLFGCGTVRWLDFNDKFLEPDGTLTKAVMNDLLHPNENGYRIWWENMQPVVKEITGK